MNDDGGPTGWEFVPFEMLFANVTSSSRKLARSQYCATGRFPVVDQGEQEVGGFTDDESLVHPGPVPVLVFGDHTRSIKFIATRFVQGADGVKVLAPSPHVAPKYTFWAMKHATIPNRGYARHFALLRELSFPLPPLPEQHRIVAAIESYFSRLDEAVALLERVQRNLKRYRASVLKAAVEGRLVPTEAALARAEGRSYEPASVLLGRILEERRRRWKAEGGKGTYKEPVAPNTTNLPELPEGWCWASLYQVSDIIAGTGFPKRLQGRSDGEVPFFKVGDISRAAQAGRKVLQRADHYVSLADCKELRATRIPAGATVFAKIGAAIALNRRAILGQPSLVDNNAFAVVPESIGLHHDYLFYFLCTIGFGEDSRATTVPSLRKDDVGLKCIPLPPIDEQIRIVEALERILSGIRHLEDQTTVQRCRAARLRQSILKWAFEGRLADQDPTDEPASVLLERIRAERAAAGASKAARRGRPPRQEEGA